MATSGSDFREARKAAGLTQAALADAAGVSRDTVSKQERRIKIDPRSFAIRKMVEVLGPDNISNYEPPRFASAGFGERWRAAREIEEQKRAAQVEEQMERLRQRQERRNELRAARMQVRCGAKTRKGTPCRHLSEPGKQRCKFHGGKSTGPKTDEGIARIAEAQRKRWEAFRYRKQIQEISNSVRQPNLDHLR